MACGEVLLPWNQRPLPRLVDWTDELLRRVYGSVGRKFDDDSVILFVRRYTTFRYVSIC